jgi:hypothetical protein
MIKFILAYDEGNVELGYFFNKCAIDLKNSLIADKHFLALEIPSQRLNELYLGLKVEFYTEDKFIFTAYSHGDENRLTSTETYLSTNSNLQPYKNTLFYTFSCLTGVTLGKKLIENGCLAFVGYKIEACIITRNEDIFIECSNFGLKQFILGENIGDSLKQMKDKHSELIDATYKKYPLVASTLRRNRNGLVLYGDKSLVINHLFSK